MKSSLMLLLLIFVQSQLMGQSQAMDRAEDVQKQQFFESRVRPLLIEQCIRCHGDEKQEGGLRLDSEEAFLKGGESGPVVDESRIENSRLLSAIHYRDLEMPPSGKLSDDQIEIFESWLSDGSYWPTDARIVLPKVASRREFRAEDRAYWFFQALKSPDLVAHRSISDEIDAAIEQNLHHVGLRMADSAEPRALVRRLYLDLLGTIPTPSEAESFLKSPTADAYSQLVDTLLEDPRYGERWGRFWLDLVRFSESDGYKQDDFRPTAYRYRDYVIRAFNSDKPYRDFIRQQLAGDELDPDSLECRDATGYLRLWIYEYNQKDVVGQWSAILNDLTDVTGEALLGLGYGCARCHDHKFDPLLQQDYYRLQAFFSGLIPRDNLPAATPEQIRRYLADEQLWREAAQPFLDTIESIEGPIRERTIQASIERFPPEVRPALRKSPSERTPYEKQLAHLASLQQNRDVREIKWEKSISKEQLEDWRAAKAFLKQLPVPKLNALPASLTATDVGSVAAEVYVPGKTDLGPILPGVPSILNPEPMQIEPMEQPQSTGRRLSLANWIVDENNPLTWRVIVNRIWQQHFGTGLVPNASDFGRLTEPPSHPELLDRLAKEFSKEGGQFKSLHRWILNSRVYRQAAYPTNCDQAMELDPNNKWLWRFAPRRLDAEQIRDSILTASGELTPSDSSRSLRSIYVRAMRNSPDRFLATFDAPDGIGSVARRNPTTTPLQSLMMMNSQWVHERAKIMARNIMSTKDSPEDCVREAFLRIHLDQPTQNDLKTATSFLQLEDAQPEFDWKTLFVDYCHVLINSNTFLHME